MLDQAESGRNRLDTSSANKCKQIVPGYVIGLKRYDGTTHFDLAEIQKIQKFVVRPDDILVASFFRSGTTLIQEIVYLIHTDLDFKSSESQNIDHRFPFLDMVDLRFPFFRGVDYIDSMPSPRLIKTHLHYHIMPESIKDKVCKIIYIARNPKDVVVSAYHLAGYLGQLSADKDTFKKYFEDFMSHRAYCTPWWRHVHDYWEQRYSENVLYLKYEEVVKNMEDNIRKIGRFLGKDLSDNVIAQIAEHCNFRKMKDNSTLNMKWHEGYRETIPAFGGHIRKGKIGGWREHFTDEMSNRVDRMVDEKLTGTGLVFDYGEDTSQ